MLTATAIFIGAGLGALLRWQWGVWLNPGGALPWGTLLANWVGAYAVGVAVVFFHQHAGLDPIWRLALVTGLLGALTTFSTFSIETVHLIQQGRAAFALINMGLHVVGSLALTFLGILTAQRLWP
jgi:fluoride exporter